MKLVCDKNKCTGCHACVEICPQKCISIADSLKSLNACIDEEKCVNCDACKKVCQNEMGIELKKPIDWYEGWAESSLREKASSGGVASALLSSFNGTVCSCVFENGEFIFSIDAPLEKYAGSKYVKSNPQGIYKEIKKRLVIGERVLFVGLPCQVAALKLFTKDHSNLYTIDLICHGTPSVEILKKYLEDNAINIKSLNHLRFRNNNEFRLYSKDTNKLPQNIRDLYMLGFLEALHYTENCYSCKYACIERVSDITLGDSWGSKLSEEEIKKGLSLILCQTEKGRELLINANIELRTVDLQLAIDNNKQLRTPSKLNEKRELFFKELEKGYTKAITKCYPKIMLKRKIKSVLVKFKK